MKILAKIDKYQAIGRKDHLQHGQLISKQSSLSSQVCLNGLDIWSSPEILLNQKLKVVKSGG